MLVDDDETVPEQIARLRRELVELKERHPLGERDQARLLEILDEMGELQALIEATSRAARLPPEPEGFAH